MGFFKKITDSNYKGEFEDGKRHGKGTYTSVTGVIYDGDWAEGKKHGYGKLTYPSGNLTYEGRWENDTFKEGKIYDETTIDHTIREGEFEIIHDIVDREKLFGLGEEEFEDKNGVVKYAGEFKNGEKNGFGSALYYSRDSEVREMHKECPDTTNCSTYVGEWKDNEYSGHGIYTCLPNKGLIDYSKDVYSECLTYFFKNDGLDIFQHSYSGQWKNGKRNGKGTQIYQDGSTYVGEWKDNMKHGKGTFTYESNDKLVGIWSDDELSDVLEEIDALKKG
jgi:hypothetical protein